MAPSNLPNDSNQSTAVAIDKDKNSQSAVKWAVDNLMKGNQNVTLIHVRVRTNLPGPNDPPLPPNRDPSEYEIKQLFLPYRGFCARKKVQVKEVVLDDVDISEAIVAYINYNSITNIVVGASSRNLLTRRIRNLDVPTCLSKTVPDFCSVYVATKGKAIIIKSANRAAPINAAPPKQLSQPQLPPDYSDPGEDANKPTIAWRSGNQEKRPWERGNDHMRTPPRDKSMSTPKITSNNFSMENLDQSTFTPQTSNNRDSMSDDGDFSGSFGFRSYDMTNNSLEFSLTSSESPMNSYSSQSSLSIDAEMKRLKLELKQTMDMYNTACKEAIAGKQKAVEMHNWKMDEERKFEEARYAEEAALAIAQIEKTKRIAAMEAAEAAQRLAEFEARRRKDAEMKIMQEPPNERDRVVNALAMREIQYRKYSIEDIKIATNSFSDSLKIGEGGYGPVFRATLDHTPVAIKVLRSDAAQGMKQFQQEVEVLSCIRHPNMVLLLGACPESGCLVYEYMDNGSLDDRLFRRDNTPPIPWKIRFKIAAEIATGLLFLHQTKPEPLVHRDLKPGNILLDHNYVSKISDVGLARLVPPSVADSVTQYHMTSAAGTFCYIDPEYQQTGLLGTKSDIYSLGIMLLQIITARPPMGLAHHVERSIEKGTFSQMLDPTVPGWPIEETLSYAKLALKCAELRKKDRPDLGSIILPELNRLKDLGDTEPSSNYNNFAYGTSSYLNSHQRSSNVSQEAIIKSNPNQRLPPISNVEVVDFNSTPRVINGERRFRPRMLHDFEDSQ